MGRAVFLPCWLFGLRHPSNGAYRLLSGGRSWCQNGTKPPGELMPMNMPHTSAASVLVPTGIHSHPPPPQETLWDQQVGLARVLWSHCFCLVSQCAQDLVCPLLGWSLCFPSPVDLLHSSSAGLQSQMLWGLLLPERKRKLFMAKYRDKNWDFAKE